MKMGYLPQLISFVAAIAAGLGHFSFWWVLIPIVVAGSFQLSNGPGFGIAMTANREGRLGVFPKLLLFNILPWLAIAGVAYWVSAALRG